MSRTKPVFNKPNDAIVMMPRTGKLTPTARKMYNVMLHRTQIEVMVFRGEGRVISAEHFFSAPLHEIVKSTIASDSKSEPMTAAKKYLLEMRSINVDWESPDANSQVVWRSMGLLSEVAIENRDGVLWALWALPPSLLMAVSDPERFTPLDLEQISKLNAYSTIALYEICARYRNNPTGLTSRNSTDWWTDALSNVSAPIDTTTGTRNRREWRKFKSEFVNRAITDINTETDLNVDLLEFKSGRTITEAQFKVRKKVLPSTLPKVAQELAELATEASVSVSAIATLMKSGASEGALKLALMQLLSRVKDSSLESVENRPAYLRKLLDELQGKIKPNMGPAPGEQPKVSGAPPLPTARTPQEERRAEMNAEFLALPRDQQKPFAEMAYGVLKAKHLATPVVARKMEQGEWTAGIIFFTAVECFAKAKYGDSWLTEHDHLS